MKNALFILLALCVVTVAVAQDGKYHLDKVYKIDKKGIIDLSSTDGKVFITGSLRPDVHVKIDREVTVSGVFKSEEEFRVDITETDGNLRIREHQKSYHSGIVTYFREDYKIVIEAPEGVSLQIRGDDGDYFVKNVNGAITLNLDDADAQLTDCKGDKFSLRIDDGDIRMDRGKGSLEIKSDDGDVEIYHGDFSSIDASVDDGDLVIETKLTNDGEYLFNCQDGLIALEILGGGGEFTIRHDDGNVTTDGSFNILHESEDKTELTLASGTAKVNVRGDDSRVKLTAVH